VFGVRDSDGDVGRLSPFLRRVVLSMLLGHPHCRSCQYRAALPYSLVVMCGFDE